MTIAYLILGSNLGNRESFVGDAVDRIEQAIGKVLQKSSVYETEPWGFAHENFFLNRVIKVTTLLTPEEMLQQIKVIEQSFGRTKGAERYSARQIDIDILFYGNEIIDIPALKIPHNEMQNRKFVLIPLVEIAENLMHPVFQKNLGQLLKECEDNSKVYKYNPLKGA